MSTAAAAITNDVLFGQTRGRILAVLYGAPEKERFLRELARDTGVSAGTIQRELGTLTDSGLVVRKRLGSQVFYRANREHPIFDDLRSLFAKTSGVFSQLQNALAPLAGKIDYAFVYGSVARGDEKPESDVDLMVIGPAKLDEVLECIHPVEKQLMRPVNPSVYSARELKAKLRANHHFLKALQKGSAVFLIGNEDEFRAIR